MACPFSHGALCTEFRAIITSQTLQVVMQQSRCFDMMRSISHLSEIQSLPSRDVLSSSQASLRGQKKYSVSGLRCPCHHGAKALSVMLCLQCLQR